MTKSVFNGVFLTELTRLLALFGLADSITMGEIQELLRDRHEFELLGPDCRKAFEGALTAAGVPDIHLDVCLNLRDELEEGDFQRFKEVIQARHPGCTVFILDDIGGYEEPFDLWVTWAGVDYTDPDVQLSYQLRDPIRRALAQVM